MRRVDGRADVGRATVFDDLKSFTVCDWVKDKTVVVVRVGNRAIRPFDNYWELDAPQGGCAHHTLAFAGPESRIIWARFCVSHVSDGGWEAGLSSPGVLVGPQHS
ncbi:hypothetical protein [Nonomuraea sp. NEAU-A123]|uniref:hypothetical protein n=1 Tax=Nonomuraea sp. NEAU-A123 TaxID=2839649 RepID=UPI001BE42625|nr:hypothetical protein [Nonomuraea sp. NEAU-A123]MBT2234865.1 hypothetical protein [Nonomuraea sp. NEAU-A123]